MLNLGAENQNSSPAILLRVMFRVITSSNRCCGRVEAAGGGNIMVDKREELSVTVITVLGSSFCSICANVSII
jgi:hypothetical protein